MGAKYTEAQAKAAKTYMEQLDRITIRVPKGRKEVYNNHAKSQGKSLNQYIYDLLENSLR